MENNAKMRIKRLLVAMVTASLVLTGFSLMPAASQFMDSDSDYGVVYAASSKAKVTFNANGGKIGSAKTKAVSITKGKSIAKLQTAKRTGYTLKGWYTKKSGGKKITKNTKVTKKTTFYAQWTAKKYTLKYDANGGKVTPASKKVAYTKGYGALPMPTLAGHTFEGWFTAKTGGTKVSTSTKMPAKNVSIYAHWKKGDASTENTFQLKIYQGFDFPKKRVLDYDDDSSIVDLKFYYQYRVTGSYQGLYVYLGANKIKGFESLPTGLTAAEIDSWQDYTAFPAAGYYYVIRARNGKHYLLHLLEYENQGQAATYWLMTFDWKEISVK